MESPSVFNVIIFNVPLSCSQTIGIFFFNFLEIDKMIFSHRWRQKINMPDPGKIQQILWNIKQFSRNDGSVYYIFKSNSNQRCINNFNFKWHIHTHEHSFSITENQRMKKEHTTTKKIDKFNLWWEFPLRYFRGLFFCVVCYCQLYNCEQTL